MSRGGTGTGQYRGYRRKGRAGGASAGGVWRPSPEAGRSGAGGAAQEDALSKAGREGRQALASGGGVPVPGCEETAARGGLAESRMATAALPVTGSDAGGYRDAWSDMGGLSGRQWAGPVPGAGHCAALPVLSAGKALPVGRPRHASDAFFLRVRFSGGQRALPRSPAA